MQGLCRGFVCAVTVDGGSEPQVKIPLIGNAVGWSREIWCGGGEFGCSGNPSKLERRDTTFRGGV